MSSGNSGAVAAWGVWGVALMGVGLTFFGLCRNGLLCWQWRRVRRDQEGEIEIGADALHAGQEASLALTQDLARGSHFAPRPARVLEVGKRTLTLRLERARTFEVSDRAGQAGAASPFALGATVTVTVTASTALYRFSARVRDWRAAGEDERLLTLARPLWLARIQRRQHARAKVALPVTLERAPDNRAGNLLYLPQRATLVNLSGGGVCLELAGALGVGEAARVQKTVAPGQILRLRLPLGGLAGQPLLVRVLTSEKMAARGGLGVRVTCCFLPMASWEQELIIAHVFDVQRGLLRDRFGTQSPPAAASISTANNSATPS